MVEWRILRRIQKKAYSDLEATSDCTLSPITVPIAKVSTGEAIQIETFDCFGGVVKPGHDLNAAIGDETRLFDNPITGPIFVEGAERGDTLVVEVLGIDLPEVGVTTTVPGFGALEGWLTQTPAITKFSHIIDDKIRFPVGKGQIIEVDLCPFIGTIGVAPESESVSTTTPGKHGGNMDVSDVCVGNKLYLPVAVEGALFGLGDVHAAQGDGEICGTAVEVPAIITLRFDLLKRHTIEWPRIESDQEIMTVCSARPLEDAARLAFKEMIKWLRRDFGVGTYEAYMLLSVAGSARLAQIVDPLYTVVAKLRKSILEQLRR